MANTPNEKPSETTGQHDFEVQKELHQKIRNDPDYDDWEYGTEPLPNEGWSNPNAAKQSPDITSQSPKP